jgi:Xaa-Pro aminopeptidase
MTSTKTAAPELPAVADRLRALRAKMRERDLGAVVVRSTDEFLNEYVPTDESLRAFITGFSGSMGDALITGDRAILIVDGRYTLQASQEAKDFEVVTIPLGTSIEEGWINLLPELRAQGIERLGLETDRVQRSLFELVERKATPLGMELVPTLPSLVESVARGLGKKKKRRRGKTWQIDKALSGASVEERLSAASPAFSKANIDAYVVVPLDELAWISNLRGTWFPYQATFPAQGLAIPSGKEAGLYVAGKGLNHQQPSEATFAGEDLSNLVNSLTEGGATLRIGYDPQATPEAVRDALDEAGGEMVPCPNPFLEARTSKTRAELEHMADAFAKADDVVKRCQSWLSGKVSRGEAVTEAEMAKHVERTFKRSGAWGLSFNVISACGKNGAVIHYGTPDEKTPVPEGAMYLLDTGAYYDGGYATDLTRTFLVGKAHVKPTDAQRWIFTVVLKGAIAGMCARIPAGTTGEQLDAIVRDPIWRAGLNYGHGTGHGVGVNVHEFPPRVAPGVRVKVQPGQVFSIEPGAYYADFGGVRIENLVTCVEDPDAPGFLRVKPLTFSPFDKRLIDKSMLTKHEKAFLKWFDAGSKLKTGAERLDYALPPMSDDDARSTSMRPKVGA